MNRKRPLPKSARRAYRRLIASHRQGAGLKLDQVAALICEDIGDPDGPSWQWVQHQESGPPEPLANVVWVDALFRVLAIDWPKALHVLGACGPARERP